MEFLRWKITKSYQYLLKFENIHGHISLCSWKKMKKINGESAFIFSQSTHRPATHSSHSDTPPCPSFHPNSHAAPGVRHSRSSGYTSMPRLLAPGPLGHSPCCRHRRIGSIWLSRSGFEGRCRAGWRWCRWAGGWRGRSVEKVMDTISHKSDLYRM